MAGDGQAVRVRIGMMTLLTLFASFASAHGGPEVYTIAPDADPQRAAMVGGLLTAGEDGWDWVCEDVWGGSALVDSVQLGDRFIFSTTFGLFWTDDGCSFTQSADFGDVWVSGLELRNDVLWAVTTDGLFTSTDGDRWSEVDGPWQGDLRGLAVTVDGAQMFVVGVQGEGDAASGVVTIGHPRTGWQSVPFETPSPDVRVHGIDSSGRAYISTPLGQDTLLRVDGTGQVETLLTAPLLVNGVSDVGGVLSVSVFTRGVQTSTDDGVTWSALSGPTIAGITTHDGVRYAGAEFGQDLALALRDTGTGFEEWLFQEDVIGPRDCPADSDAAVTCAGQWEEFVDFLNSTTTNEPRNEPEPGPQEETGCSTLPGPGLGLLALLPLLGLRRRREPVDEAHGVGHRRACLTEPDPI